MRRLREQAAERLKWEEAQKETSRDTAPVYGSPAYFAERAGREPSTVYGGPPTPVTRRWTLRGIVLLILGAISALAAAIWGYRKITAPVYGGPPAAVYGGPPAPAPTPPPSEPQK